jgi:ATP-dependent DNA helicase RecG
METTTKSTVRGIVTQLLVQPAERVESETVEIKSWCKNAKEFYEKLAEAASCLANAHGGILILGIGEDDSDGPKFRACPYRELDVDLLSRKLADVTMPPVKGAVHDISEIVSELSGVPEAQAYALAIPKTEKISGHMTAKGVSKIRVGKECRPNFTAEDDRTKALIPGSTIGDLSESSISWAMAAHRRRYPRVPVSWTSQPEFLVQAGLLPDQDMQSVRWISLASLLLFGNEKSLAKYVGHCETSIKTPSGTTTLRKNIVDSFRDLCGSKAAILTALRPQLSADVLKEVLMNAYIHRCYRAASGVIISVTEESISVQSPGGLAAGLNTNNLLYCVPVYRNISLAEGARYIGLCDKVGQGIDLIYHEIISEGYDFPLFEDDGNSLSVTLPTSGSQEFREFVRKRIQALGRLEEIVALRALFSMVTVSLADLSSAIQRGTEQTRRILGEMEKKMMVVANADGSYELSAVIRQDIESVFNRDQLKLKL